VKSFQYIPVCLNKIWIDLAFTANMQTVPTMMMIKKTLKAAERKATTAGPQTTNACDADLQQHTKTSLEKPKGPNYFKVFFLMFLHPAL